MLPLRLVESMLPLRLVELERRTELSVGGGRGSSGARLRANSPTARLSVSMAAAGPSRMVVETDMRSSFGRWRRRAAHLARETTSRLSSALEV
jgi:hypothetical protein